MQVLIIGAGGHGRVVVDILRAGGQFQPAGFIDSTPSLAGTTVAGLPVFGGANQLSKVRQQHKLRHAIVAIGDNRVRLRYAALLKEQGFELINAIHPTASIAATASLGRNIVIAAQVAVCNEATIGDSCILNTGCVVDHECELGKAVHVCPGTNVAGRVRVGACAWLGIGCTIIQCLSIGQHAIVGAGTVVIRDVPDFATVVGVPARVIKTNPPPDAEPVIE
jgi:sugar O-acyltransferase (sialic acid O-acetyltransferase NeuD family)